MQTTSHSATVVLTLVVNGQRLSLSHVGPNEVIIRDQCESMPPGDATLLIRVDESRKKRQVFLPHGVSGSGVPVTYL